jgi:oligosaccharide repeat unit polymerase
VGVLKRDFFHPTVFYVFCQTVTLGIAYLKVSRAMTDFTAVTWFVWLGALVAFLLGSGLYYLVSPRRHIVNRERLKEIGGSYNWKLHFAFSTLLTVLFVIGALMVARSIGGFYLFNIGKKTLEVGTDTSVFANVSYASSPIVVVALIVASFKSYNPYKYIRIASFLMAVGVIVLSVCVYPGRNSLFLCLGSAFILFNYLKKKIPVKAIVSVLLLAVSSFVVVGMMRSQYADDSLEGMGLKYMMKLPYDYVANNYWNLDYAINSPSDREIHPYTYGLDMAGVLIEYSGIPGSFRKSYDWDDMFNKRIQKVYGLNTVNYLWEVYKNFGMAGCIFFPFAVSFLMSFLYERMCSRCTPQMFMLMSFSIYYVGWSFFAAGFKFAHVWLWVYIAILIGLICNKRLLARNPELSQN